MQAAGQRSGRDHRSNAGARRPWIGVVATLTVVCGVLIGIFAAADWYAGNVSMSRHCADPERALALVERVLTEARPAGEQRTRPYVVAAKLLYLVPQRAEEPERAYLARLRGHIEAACRRAGTRTRSRTYD